MNTAPAAYDAAFFDHQSNTSSDSAAVVVPLVMDLISPTSVVDVGCGVGAWLREFANAGVGDFLGLDGDYVEPAKLMIPPERFRGADLSAPQPLDRTFDLAGCLEVAEHLPARAAGPLVDLLTAASPVVLFSAAVPGQGGTQHVNEQWPVYWRCRFAANGYERLDPIRPRIWREAGVSWWFKQNLFLFVRRDVLTINPRLKIEAELATANPFELVHADLVASFDTLKGVLKALPRVAWSAVRRRLPVGGKS